MLTLLSYANFSRAGRRIAPPAAACTLFFSALSCYAAAPAPVSQTGQQRCYEAGGNLISDCAGTGQDGDRLSGAAWPAPRFRDNDADTFTDLLTGLTWTKDAEAPGPAACSHGTPMSWDGALTYIKCLNSNSYLGKSDWRLPNIVELRSLFHGNPLPDGEPGSLADWLNNLNIGIKNLHALNGVDRYKSSTPGSGAMGTTPWTMSLFDGSSKGFYYGHADHIWPVRTDATAAAAPLPQTGVTDCYQITDAGAAVKACAGTGQDGELKQGVAWPSPRFTVQAETVADNLTGLEWVKDGVTQQFGACSGGLRKWQDALSFVDCLNANRYLNQNDWRAPNLNEMMSLSNPAGDASSWPTGFTMDLGLQHQYWTSTNYMVDPSQAWAVGFGSVGGSSMGVSKVIANYILPVRNLGGATGTPVTFKRGDVNKDGAVDISDVVLIYRFYKQLQTPTLEQKAQADVAPLGSDHKPVGDNEVTLGDVVTALRYSVEAVTW